MGKDREFTFRKKLEIISHYESLVASGIKISKKALTKWALKKYFEQRPNDALSHIKSIQRLHKEVSSHHLEASCQTTIDSFFRLVGWKNLVKFLLYRLFLSISLVELCIIICICIFYICKMLCSSFSKNLSVISINVTNHRYEFYK